jgi:RimJ/RimL family protein N-acetyltransferase
VYRCEKYNTTYEYDAKMPVLHISFGFTHSLWWMWFADDRRVASVVPGAGDEVLGILSSAQSQDSLFDDQLATDLCNAIEKTLVRLNLPVPNRSFCEYVFACEEPLFRPQYSLDCHRLLDDSVRAAEGLRLPLHCFPDGVVYGVIRDKMVVSVAHAHRSGELAESVADVGIETAPAYRRNGYGKAVLSSLVAHFIERGGASRYSCSPSNTASAATALSVGFIPYAKSLMLASPRKKKSDEK